jgi:S-adenosylmethionine hydrolase
MQASGLITLTTDFGLQDSYVAMMKGVLLSIHPQARPIDYTHAIAPQNIAQAAYQIHTGYRYFPPGTVHLVVVDPGVGSERRAIALQTPEAFFVAPDNGLLALIWYEALERWGRAELVAVELTEQRFWRQPVSATFHGRDIFAPVAAQLAAGRSIHELGQPIEEIALIERLQAQRGRPGELLARIIHVDNFGNCITNVTLEDLRSAGLEEQPLIMIIDQQITGLCRTYADGQMGTPIALISSSGFLEVAVRNGNAAQQLGVGIGDLLRVYA